MTASSAGLVYVAAIMAVVGAAVGSAVEVSPSVNTAELLHGHLMARSAISLQPFRGDLAGVAADAITQSSDSSRQYEVNGDTFMDFATAASRACDNQHNSCADAANRQTAVNVTVSDCDTQNTECKAVAASATQTAFPVLTTSNTEFDFFCDQ
ncbi:hypothetical protein CMQ_4996 [Grosmannia clavigera kw1407]|uniref:Uncharacterized protein n=1 Tax=Grosmannia clavigera (strain kw1407 / UAMH 11150) TaxID=655863 RepID=F0XJZ3_GROCL|nr:uncharacterized protein CMQ_4996 [Grosmannia clavigera kw1407]EFX01925.1 hypothetical protein CMQ_4996 [Grosmannia clavigera kw1407]